MTQVFSGCGMSRRVADWIGDIPGTEGYVMPTYGWRVPKAVRRTLSRPSDPAAFVWAVFTCGDDVGRIDRHFERLLGRRLDAAFSVVMPDTYLGLPGFRLDSPEETAAKTAAAEVRCRQIRARLLARETVRDLKRGPCAWLKTEVVGRCFDRVLCHDRFFHLTPGKCLRCGACAAGCPTKAIRLGEDGRPVWTHGGVCTGCFRCYHFCPGEAIEFGPFTRGKGRLFRGPEATQVVSCVTHSSGSGAR